ncbi:hypothetical protein GOP47_0005073 [Adiantum capillus-veneris]|uniref:Uncharacterized protein n=1 Tax=Adiantum capillus-veneris TaxID=13818 RepID=A0A9D4V4V7_ADICA|nr:hypothetical protein GOP47_0005073 [Adiantum capillus-veneris]
MGTLGGVLTIILVVFCMPGCFLSQACRSVPLHLPAGRVQRPFQPHLKARVQLASTVSKHVEDQATSLQTASSLLALLGGKQAALSVDPSLAHQILPYLRFLVSPPQELRADSARGSLHPSLKQHSKMSPLSSFLWKEKFLVESLIHWPPPAVADLAREAVEWNGDASVILNSLSSESYLVPDVEGANEQHCQLTKYLRGQRFIKEELNQYFAFLFETISALAPSVGFNVSLDRFDLFHGHLFLANTTGRLGILFHAREYPAFDEKTFPVHLGYCQVGSPLPYDDSMNLRNILWLAPMPDCTSRKCADNASWLAPGSLLVLDAHPEGIIYKNLVPEYVDVVRTVYEDDFGAVIVDVNYFATANDKLADRLFIC